MSVSNQSEFNQPSLEQHLKNYFGYDSFIGYDLLVDDDLNW